MKKTILVALLILFVFSSFGQKIRFSDTTNRWHYYLWSDAVVPPISYPYIDAFTGDTVRHGIAYKKLNHLVAITIVYIREDTVANKVYAIMTVPPYNDTTEQLLYDYNLNAGDTFQNNHIRYTVTSKDSVTISALTYHTWHLHPFHVDSISMSFGFANDIDVIEGIGCVNDPCFPLKPFSFESITDLNCFSNRGATPPLSATVGPYFNNSTSCSLTFGLGVSNINSISYGSTIIPNPINSSSIITLPYKIATGSIIITNCIGQTVYNSIFQNNTELLIGDKVNVSGTYFYKVVDNSNGATYTGKFALNR